MGQKFVKSGEKKICEAAPSLDVVDDSKKYELPPCRGSALKSHFYLQRYLWQGYYSVPLDLTTKAYVLDVGYGSKLWLNEIGLEYRNIHFVGVDLLSISKPTFQVPNVEYVYADPHNLPFEQDSFDLVHLFSTNFEPIGKDWNKMLREATRVLKPGGYLQIDEVELPPLNSGPLLEKIWQSWQSIIVQSGNNMKNISHHIKLNLVSIRQIEEVKFDKRISPFGPRGGKVGDCQEQIMLHFFKDEMAERMAENMGLRLDYYLKYLDRAVDELRDYDVYNESFRFWGRKVQT